MFPCFFFWCPHLHFPLSGEVRQQWRPDMFFQAIAPACGPARIEAEIFEQVASYGRQIGILNDLVLALCEPSALPPEQRHHALEQLRALHHQIETLKARQPRPPLNSTGQKTYALSPSLEKNQG
jgi:hypothetical protein